MNTTIPAHHKQVTIFKVVVDIGTQQPRIASTQAVDKGGDAYWDNGRNGHFGFLKRIPKFTVETAPELAVKSFVASQRDKAKALRESADAIDAVALAAEKLA